jgi:hypothetical protein
MELKVTRELPDRVEKASLVAQDVVWLVCPDSLSLI